ncbi:MAG: glycosyltransferase family 4 protein [Bacteroidales bacterium]
MPKFKIAFIGQKGLPATYGGVEKHVEELGVRLAQRGHRIIAYSRKNYNRFSGNYKGIKVINLPAIPEKHTEMISHSLLCCLDVHDKDIDIVHIQSVDPSIISFLPRIKTKVVATSHGQAYRREKWGKVAKSFSQIAERVYSKIPCARIAVSKTLKKFYEAKYGCYVHYIPNGVNLPSKKIFPSSKLFLIDEKEVHLEKNSYILYVGRILPTKGVDILIEAWNKLSRSRSLNSNIKLAITGGSSYTDDYVNNLKQRTDDSVVWLGYRYGEDLQWLYSNAYCVVIPSEIEGLAFTLLESMSYGKCIIYSDIPENDEAANGVGIPFQNKNTDDLAKKITLALHSPDMLQDFGERARERIKKYYNWDDIVCKTETLYNSLYRI